jgi:hypothetical protein
MYTIAVKQVILTEVSLNVNVIEVRIDIYPKHFLLVPIMKQATQYTHSVKIRGVRCRLENCKTQCTAHKIDLCV